MRRIALFAIVLPLLVAAAPPAVQRVEVSRTVVAIFRPYSIEALQPAVWERPLFTAEVRRLITRWQQVMPKDDTDGLNDGDWLCLCQDWSPRQFRATIRALNALPGGAVEASLRIDLGNGQQRDSRLVLRRESGRWRIDEIFAADFPQGLKQALRETIAEDEKLPR